MISFLFLLCGANYGNGFNDYPSLISTNATMAIVADRSFFDRKEDHRNAIGIISKMITEAAKKDMHLGGISIEVFYDTKVNIQPGYAILLSIATCYQTWHLHEVARKEELIHLAITDPDCPRIPDSEGFTIPLVVPGEELSQIFLDLRMINAVSWNIINILHDDTFDKNMIGRVIKAISNDLPNSRQNLLSRTIFTLKHGDTNRDRKDYIKKLLINFPVEQLGNFFLVVATADMVMDVMDVARYLKMVHPSSQWFYIITDSLTQNTTNITSFVDLLPEGGNVAFLYNATDTNGMCDANLMCYTKKLIRALSISFERSLMIEIELFKRVSDEEFEIIRLTKAERRREVLKNMRRLLSESMLHFEDICGACLHWRFSSAITWGNFFLHGKNEAHLLDVGTWMPGIGLNLTDMIFPHVAHGFRGIRVPIATYQNPPWQIITTSNTGEKLYDGLVFDVIKHLSNKLNFTYTVVAPSIDKVAVSNISQYAKLGDRIKDMTMSNTRTLPAAIIEQVRGKKVLMAACAYTVNDYGKSTINFTVPIFVQTYSFLTSRPRQLSRVLLFASPFTKETWACLGVSIIIMGPILYVVHKYSPASTKTSGLNSSWQCIWYVYGALLQQGGMYLPHSDSARILVGSWWIVVMVLVASYSGSLVAFLTFPRMDASILTVEDLLARKDRMTWSIPNGTFLEEHLRNSDEEKYRLLLARSMKHNDSEDEERMKLVKGGKHALIDWRSSLRFLMRKDVMLTGRCHFSLSTDEFMDEPIAMIIAQESPYLPIINSELHRMIESGLMNKWISERMPMKDKCSEPIGNNQAVNKRKVNVADMQGIFFVLFMGVISASFLLCCEFYWNRRKLLKERKLIRPFAS